METYLPAIDILMCHTGKTFDEACEELGLNMAEEMCSLQELKELKESGGLPEN